MVECEYVKYGSRAYRYLVLIDTWWNVNIKFVTAPAAAESRFNRYMVECEYSSYERGSNENNSFNRYMVECELNSDRCRLYISYSFNRYMVECEFWSMTTDKAVIVVLIDT